jgi:6-phosphogluconolactonase
VPEPNVQILDDPVPALTEALLAAVATGGDVVLTGGSTPKGAYERAAAQHADAFAGARLWFSDERCVAPEDERSNYGMVAAALLEPIAAAGVGIGFCRRMRGELGPEAGAADYEDALQQEGVERFALAVLGIGSDGHIASMFPGQDSLAERARLVLGVPDAGLEPFVPRISLSFPALALAERVLVLATGASKAEAISAAFGRDAAPTPEVPASLLAEHVQALTVLLDHDAAARL